MRLHLQFLSSPVRAAVHLSGGDGSLRQRRYAARASAVNQCPVALEPSEEINAAGWLKR